MVVVVWAIASCAWAQTPAGDANGGAKIAKISPPCVGCVEIVERRTQNGKVFRDPADARTLYFQSFAGPVHIRDHDGVWREPDPRFVFQSGKWVCKRTFLPLSFEPHSGAAWILPDGAELRLNARNRVVAVRADGVEISEVLNLSGATVEGTRITVAEAAPGVNIISEAQAFGLKTNYELLVPPDPQIAVWAVEEAIPLPPGYRIAFDEHAQTTYLGRLGEVVLYDPAGNEAARWERPKIFDSAPERDESRRAELIAAALRAGLEQTPYAYTLKVENDTARLRLVVDARLLRLPQVRYPVVVDPQVTVAYASTTVLGVGQNMTCSIPLVYTVPGGYSVVNVVNDMFRYQATGLCCGFDFLGICLGTQCSFNGVRARVSGPCGQAEGFCNSPGQGSCTLTGDVPFVADCVVGQCNDYTIELRAHLVSQTACGGTSCAATDCFRMNAGDVAFTLVARSVETTAATDVAPLVGVPPTAQVCAETPFRLVGLPAYGVPPYTFEWFLPDGTVLADSMPELVLYENTPITLIAYDACGASEPFSFTILVLAPPAFSETITMPTCGVDNGSIALTNLPPGATINWSDGSNQPTRTGLAPGTYTVVVDDGTCSKTKQYLLEAAAEAVNLNLQIVPPNCQNPVGGTIVVSAQGNFGPYQYAVVSQQGQLPDFQSSPTFTGLGAGTYTLRVLDVNGCVYVHPEPVVFSVPEPIEVNEIATVADACFGAYTGAVVLNGVTGGTGDFQFSLSGGPWQGSPAFTGLGAGVYGLRIRDGGGCEYSTTVVVPRSAPMTLNTSVVPVDCDAPGVLSVAVEGGSPPYVYSFDNGQNFDLDSTRTSDEPSGFWVRVRDANGCVAGTWAELPGVRTLRVAYALEPPTCAQSQDGAIRLFAQADEYSIDGGQTFLTPSDFSGTVGLFEGLSVGTYSIVVRNADGCERRLEALLPAQTPQMRFSLNRETICAGDLVWVHVSGPEQVSWTAPDDGPALQTSDEGRLAGFRPQTTVVFTVTGHFGPQCALIETLTVNVLPKNELRAGFYPQNTIFERPPYAVEFVNVSDADVECEWDFGDQGVSTQFSPTRVYADTGRYEVRLRVRRPGTCDESVVRQTIHVRQADPSARPEFPGAFTLYPNPNDGRVHVFSPQALKAFVYDANGRKVFEAEVLGVEEWDWSSLAPGAYVCTFLRPDGTVFALKACKR